MHQIWPCLSTAHQHCLYHSFCWQNVTTFPCTQKQGQQFHRGTEKAACVQSAFMSIVIPHGECTTFLVLNMMIFFKEMCCPVPVFLLQYTKDRLYDGTAMFNNLSKGEGREALTLIIQNICKLGQNKCFL